MGKSEEVDEKVTEIEVELMADQIADINYDRKNYTRYDWMCAWYGPRPARRSRAYLSEEERE